MSGAGASGSSRGLLVLPGHFLLSLLPNRHGEAAARRDPRASSHRPPHNGRFRRGRLCRGYVRLSVCACGVCACACVRVCAMHVCTYVHIRRCAQVSQTLTRCEARSRCAAHGGENQGGNRRPGRDGGFRQLCPAVALDCRSGRE